MGFELIIPLLAGAGRNIFGWLEGALKDGTIDKFEWGQLAGTILEVAVLSFSVMYGLGLDVTAASGIGVLGSFILSGLKKVGTK